MGIPLTALFSMFQDEHFRTSDHRNLQVPLLKKNYNNCQCLKYPQALRSPVISQVVNAIIILRNACSAAITFDFFAKRYYKQRPRYVAKLGSGKSTRQRCVGYLGLMIAAYLENTQKQVVTKCRFSKATMRFCYRGRLNAVNFDVWYMMFWYMLGIIFCKLI